VPPARTVQERGEHPAAGRHLHGRVPRISLRTS
jgi:hypothetical protein